MSTSSAIAIDREDVAIDEARTFLGPNASFYDESWRVMLWRGRRTSWNPHAALLGPVWLGYRRMPTTALAYLGWLQLVWLVQAHGWSLWLVTAMLALGMLVTGTYANAIYLSKFHRMQHQIRSESGSVLKQEQFLKKHGGVSQALAFTFGAVAVIQAALSIYMLGN